MANRQILAIVTALLMLGNPVSAQQATTIDELRRIEQLVSNQNWSALYSLVSANPRLTQGSDPLSVELRGFMRQGSLGRIALLAPAPATVPRTVRSQPGIAVAGDIY